MATAQDAELILKLYELRTEPVMRRARHFVMDEFQPARFDDIVALQRDRGSERNGWWRQVRGYWDMAAALVLRGALDADLFLDTCDEAIYLHAKLSPFEQQYVATFGYAFTERVAKLIETFPAAQDRYTMLLAMMAAQARQAAG